MDPDILPSALAEYVADCAKRMRIPAEMIATPLMVAFGNVIGKKYCVQPRSKDPTWIEYPNFWGASILPPAMLKSPSLNAGMKFINELETTAQRVHAKAMAEWISEERIRKLQIKILEGKAKKALNSGDKAEARKLLDEVEEIKPPIRKRFVISDATPEARLEILCDNPNGILLLRDELDGHIAQLKKEGYENARAQELQFFDGHQDYTDDRIKRGSHIAEGPRMALYGNLQPAKVEKYLIDMHKGGSDDGYLQRLLQLAIQPTIPKEFDLEESKPDIAAEDKARHLFQAINSIPLERCQITRRIVPTVLKFDPDAQLEFEEFLVSIENKLRSGDVSNAVLAAHFGKYRGTLAKLALLIALADNPLATSISLNSYRQAESLLQFYSQHARRIYNVVARYDLASAYELLDRIKKSQLHDGFNPREDIHRREWPKLRSSGEIEAALELLEKHGYVKLFEEQTGGRPKRIVRIHPELIRQKGTEVAASP
jgi:putative DNA primase/helicase